MIFVLNNDIVLLQMPGPGLKFSFYWIDLNYDHNDIEYYDDHAYSLWGRDQEWGLLMFCWLISP